LCQHLNVNGYDDDAPEDDFSAVKILLLFGRWLALGGGTTGYQFLQRGSEGMSCTL
jgi:hypothetical protein